MKLEIMDPVNGLPEMVKEETGKEVLLFENRDMASMLEVKTARNSDKNHLMAYSDKFTPEINHLIASKAIQILRTFREKPENRKIAVAYQEHINNARMSIASETLRKPHIQMALNDHNLTSTWVLSLVNQLISQPVNIHIESEIFNNYPDLREFQQKIIGNQFNDFKMTLSKEVEELSPSVIYNSSAIMNYVYLKFMDRITGSDFIGKLDYVVKKNKSEKLFEYTLANIDDSISSDIKIIDHWAESLNISNWYTWVDFETT